MPDEKADSTMSRPLAALVGRQVGGRYRLVRPLGRGGTGAVYEAERLPGGEPVAIKVLLPGAEGAEAAALRLRREAAAARLLAHPEAHPHIVQIHELVEGPPVSAANTAVPSSAARGDRDEPPGPRPEGLPVSAANTAGPPSAARGDRDGPPGPRPEGPPGERGELYLVMELLRGRSVAAALCEGPLGARRALVIARQVLSALGHAHARGAVHRDLKPDHVLLTPAGEPGRQYERAKLIDFGLVKLIGPAAALDGDAGAAKLTRTGTVFGTPAYMAPEQALGRPILDGRADLYALGASLYEMLTGRTPFRSPDPVTLVRMQAQAPAPPLAASAPGRPWITPALERLVARALAKRPEDRFADAAEMTAALDLAFASLDHLPPGA